LSFRLMYGVTPFSCATSWFLTDTKAGSVATISMPPSKTVSASISSKKVTPRTLIVMLLALFSLWMLWPIRH